MEFVFSPTYWLADYRKSKYKRQQKAEVGKLIKKYNSIYLVLAILLAIGMHLLSPVDIYNVNEDMGDAFIWAAGLLIWIYPLSRANEIIFSFYRDAIEKLNGEPSRSDLKFGDRIKLAMRSYVELVVNFATIYALLPPSYFDCGISSYLDALYFSGVTITTLGYGDISPSAVFPQLLSIYEVLCGFMLIVVSFAVYTGRGLEQPTQDLNK